jgi:predicted ATP-dependent serine protease
MGAVLRRGLTVGVSLVVVTGPPGAGKSTVDLPPSPTETAAEIARRVQAGTLRYP